MDSAPDSASVPDAPAKKTGSSAKPAASRSRTTRTTAAKSPAARTPRKPVARASTARAAKPKPVETVLSIQGLVKRFGETIAVAGVDLAVEAGSFYGIVGPNGAGKTTTLSMIAGLLRPDAGTITVHGIDVWSDPVAAKRTMGVLPDRLRLFDRLTGA
ncbi:MAG TPA: ATP-binding cassette domain-containing protein, partial [Galbitalea sp.]